MTIATSNGPSASLREAAEKCGLSDIPNDRWEVLEAYCRSLWEWNSRMNLTRHTDFDLFARRDLLDSWHLSNLLAPDEEVLDIGTGGGVPGIVVAILRPDVQMTLCDSVGKKARAVEEMVASLGLKIPVYPRHVKGVLEDFSYDSLVVRGVGPLIKICGWLNDHWHQFGRLLAIKGPKWVEERGEARHRGFLKQIELRKAVSYPMPDTQSESVILQLRRLRPGEKSQHDD